MAGSAGINPAAAQFQRLDQPGAHAPGEDRPTEPNDLREIKTMLAQRISQWLQEARLQGEAQGEARGEARGETKGEAQTLLKLLRLKFGPLPADMELRVHAAAKAQLDAWVERILTTERLEDVWDEPLSAAAKCLPSGRQRRSSCRAIRH